MIGESMNEMLNRFRMEYPDCKKITYAGRLDPIAYGLVIILTDEDINRRDEICGNIKEYNFKLLKGFQTDTYDIMGMIMNDEMKNIENMLLEKKEYDMSYPPYSSVPIKEHYLQDRKIFAPYWYCTKNNLKVENIPTKKITLYDFNVRNLTIKTGEELLELIKLKINTVKKPTFRQNEIIDIWEQKLNKEQCYEIYDCNIVLSSGGYVRSFGNMLNSVCFDIERVKYINIY